MNKSVGGGVDVLEIMELDAHDAHNWRRDVDADHGKSAKAESENARFAVLELIEAASEVTKAFRAIGDDKTIIAPAGLVKRAEDAMLRLDAAVSNIGSTP